MEKRTIGGKIDEKLFKTFKIWCINNDVSTGEWIERKIREELGVSVEPPKESVVAE